MPVSATSWQVVVVGVAVPGTAEQVASHRVPEGMVIGVTARDNNTGNMYIAETQVRAQTAANRKRLSPGQSTTLYIDDTNRIWVDSDNANDRLEIVPQKIPSTGG